MAIRFPVRRPETNEVIHPDDLNKNLSEFVDEINGHIDSDNFTQRLDADNFKANAFTQNYSKSYTSNSDKYRVSRKTIGWTTQDRNDKKMPIIEFIAPSDGWIIIDFNATFRWKGSGILTDDDVHSKVINSWHVPTGRWARMNQLLPPGGWMSITPFQAGYLSTYQYPAYDDDGSDGVEAIHVVKVQNGSVGNWAQGLLIRDRFGVQFHVEVNGVEIAESGWLYNGAYCNGVYLCGSIPVTAGKNIIKSEVRGASLHALKPSKSGIGATFEEAANVKGKYTSAYSTISSQTETILPAYWEGEPETVESGWTEYTESIDGWIRTRGIKCHVLSRNLVVQYRAR